MIRPSLTLFWGRKSHNQLVCTCFLWPTFFFVLPESGSTGDGVCFCSPTKTSEPDSFIPPNFHGVTWTTDSSYTMNHFLPSRRFFRPCRSLQLIRGCNHLTWNTLESVSWVNKEFRLGKRNEHTMMTCAYYCWWLKSCTTWDVWNPINNGKN